jgi:hypothetical protein
MGDAEDIESAMSLLARVPRENIGTSESHLHFIPCAAFDAHRLLPSVLRYCHRRNLGLFRYAGLWTCANRALGLASTVAQAAIRTVQVCNQPAYYPSDNIDSVCCTLRLTGDPRQAVAKDLLQLIAAEEAFDLCATPIKLPVANGANGARVPQFIPRYYDVGEYRCGRWCSLSF